MKWPAYVMAVTTLAASGAVAAQGMPESQSKTREQVREEIAEARRDGLLPYKRHDYPPSAATIKRNKELYAIAHPGDAAVKEASASADAK
ncbi:hypothetical protein AWB81_05069 [Caballeronia arationis]|uniref:DUF4148 domain-containing protein n=1 Tax=Caballeronia arationis TaxID=1777142 RepID=UPI00074CE701|nr:DUF4148 domain-containing protein [Caballeronia arationis]SAK93032.1 hypothetical protein AWB81_05069 [Caballeronia arationis]